MFGFSLQKLLVLAAIIGAVWYGFKLVSRLQEARDLEQRKPGGSKPGGSEPGRQKPGGIWRWASRAKEPDQAAEDMVQCPVCKTYVAARGSSSCGRPDCPY